MAALPIPRSSTPGSRPGEGQGRLINCYSVREGDVDVVRRCPGLLSVFATTGTGLRGMIEANFGFYAVFGDKVAYISYPGPTVAYLAGTIPGTDPVTLAINNRTPAADVVAVRRDGGAYVLTPTAVSPYPLTQTAEITASITGTTLDVTFLATGALAVGDGIVGPGVAANTFITALGTGTGGTGAYTVGIAQSAGSAGMAGYRSILPANVNSVAFLDGYFLFTVPDGRIYASALNSTDIDALSFATAESRADGLRRGIVCGALFYAMGGSTIEPWQNVGSSPFPLQRAQTILPTGIRATMAAAGDGPGWDHGLIFVAADGSVRTLDGYSDAVISTPDVERFIAASVPAELDMMAHIARGRPLVTVSSPLGSWAYDVRGRAWHERVSAGLARWRAGGALFTSSGAWLLGDRLSGHILAPAGDFREAGAAMTVVIESGPLKDYPARLAIPSLFADFTAADAGQIDVSWSHDGGKTFSAPLSRSLAMADRVPVRVNRLGLSTHHGLRARLASSSDADFAFMGAGVPDPQVRPRARAAAGQ
ncbi:hypothetical protein [Chelatococcus reniformis]|uniref:Uncharacterized protein n=1 Tax=Chelatococcus reniformis TaxID=1494448 RepID=A0A916U2L8_9HYPH|nr:hypothetical protein [Chelatococcus reniformis]GGC58314.1 hypothetical protein GCM10010994_16570 [Chelatococcus reniformis]